MNKIICGDALTELKKLDSESVNCCVTSPPYWGLRDYGTAKWEGGDSSCNHQRDNKCKNTNTGQKNVAGSIGDGIYKGVCKKCGAVRVDKQLGLEKTPEEYVSKMVEIFAEVKRVLRSDGTLWLNLGDGYSNQKGMLGENGPGYCNTRKTKTLNKKHQCIGGHGKLLPKDRPHPTLKRKDLIGIPWMVAFALRGAGWYLRQDIIWSKPNPMPESVTDRCTKSHEYIFLLTKSAKYYYDADAIKGDVTTFENRPNAMERSRALNYKSKYDGTGMNADVKKQSTPSGWNTGPGRHDTIAGRYPKGNAKTFRGGRYTGGRPDSERTSHGNEPNQTGKRNKRSVWPIATRPFPEAHFTTFPEDLIKPCVLAGCPEGGTVLDPFIGSGTTAKVARDLNRQYIGIELNPEYIKIIDKRLQQQRVAI